MIHALAISLAVRFHDVLAKDWPAYRPVHLVQNMGKDELQQFFPSWFHHPVREIAVGFAPSAPTLAPWSGKDGRRHFHGLSVLEESQRFARHVQPPMSEFVFRYFNVRQDCAISFFWMKKMLRKLGGSKPLNDAVLFRCGVFQGWESMSNFGSRLTALSAVLKDACHKSSGGDHRPAGGITEVDQRQNRLKILLPSQRTKTREVRSRIAGMVKRIPMMPVSGPGVIINAMAVTRIAPSPRR